MKFIEIIKQKEALRIKLELLKDNQEEVSLTIKQLGELEAECELKVKTDRRRLFEITCNLKDLKEKQDKTINDRIRTARYEKILEALS